MDKEKYSISIGGEQTPLHKEITQFFERLMNGECSKEEKLLVNFIKENYDDLYKSNEFTPDELLLVFPIREAQKTMDTDEIIKEAWKLGIKEDILQLAFDDEMFKELNDLIAEENTEMHEHSSLNDYPQMNF